MVLNMTDETVMNGIISIIDKTNKQTWTGTMTELSMALNKSLSRDQIAVLPGSPSALRVAVNRVVNRLRNRKVSIKFTRTNDRARTRFVRFSR